MASRWLQKASAKFGFWRIRITNLAIGAFSNKYLLTTNLCLCASMSGAGDLVQQTNRIIRGKRTYRDFKRTSNMALASLPMGAMCHYWYIWLDNKFVGTSGKIVAKKVLLDQILLSPVMWFVYFVTLNLVDRSTTGTLVSRLKMKCTKIYLAEWMVWPPAQIINFYFLPTRYRVLYDNVISFGFDWYTSYLIHDT